MLSAGWIPTYSDPDNASMAEEAEPFCPKCEGVRIPRHPVDALKLLGVPMTPEFEAQARAYCDEAVEMPQEMPARFQHSERSAIEP